MRTKITFDEGLCNHGLKTEMKAKGGKLTPEQRAYKEQCEREGYLFAVVDNVDDFVKLLKLYLGNPNSSGKESV